MKTATSKARPHVLVYEDGRIYDGLLGRFIRQTLSSESNGRYPRVSLDRKRVPVHVLVAEAFIGPRPSPAHLCLHKDDNKNNPRPENLYWGTKKDNAQDAIRNGRQVHGSRNGGAKLSEAAVILIRELAGGGETHAVLASSFNVAQSTITDIVNHKRWKHLK